VVLAVKIVFRSGLRAYPKAATAVVDALRQGYTCCEESEKLETLKVKNKRIKTMANHKSSKKRIRQTVTKRAHNRLYHKTTRNAVKALRNTTERSAAEALLPKVSSMLDKLAKTNIIHKNKAANLKSSLALHVNAL
jgi:small subunit ribosomal protein S20